MDFFEDSPESYLATITNIFQSEGLREIANLIRTSTARVEQTGFDNWNGGTKIWTLFLDVAPSEYAQLGQKKEIFEEKITTRLKPLLEQYQNDWYSVSIVPQIVSNTNWRDESYDLPKQAIRNIIDGLKIENVSWFGKLDDVEFLQRIFDLESLPSHDPRFETASGDIWQHRYNNHDWEDVNRP